MEGNSNPEISGMLRKVKGQLKVRSKEKWYSTDSVEKMPQVSQERI